MPTLFPSHTLLFLSLLNGNTREKFARDPQGSRSAFKEMAQTQAEKPGRTQQNGCLGNRVPLLPRGDRLGDMRASSTRVG